jgi:hypothetical protein
MQEWYSACYSCVKCTIPLVYAFVSYTYANSMGFDRSECQANMEQRGGRAKAAEAWPEP